MEADHDQRHNNIGKGHKGRYDARHVGNALDAPENDERKHHGKGYAAGEGGDREGVMEG